MKNNQNFLSENFHYFVVKFSVYLKRHVFVMALNCVGSNNRCRKLVPLHDSFGIKGKSVCLSVSGFA